MTILKKTLVYCTLFIILLITTNRLEAAIIYANVNSTCTSNCGTSWSTAFPNLQAAFLAAQPGDEVWIAEGTYYPTSTNDINISFYHPKDASVYGGFDGTESSKSERDWWNHPTILSGKLSATTNSYHVYTIYTSFSNDMYLDGVIIEEGSGASSGGGVLLPYDHSSQYTLHIQNTIFRNNSTTLRGGAIHSRSGNKVRLNNCIFKDNGSVHGSAVYIREPGSSSHEINNCTFYNNIGTAGSAIYNYMGALLINNSIVWSTPNSSNVWPSISYFNLVAGQYYGELKNVIVNLPNDISSIVNVAQSNISYADPQFLNTDLELSPTSPAIDGGINLPNLLNRDIKGKVRTIGNSVDLGAHEFGYSPLGILQMDISDDCLSNTGSASVMATNGVPPYSYAWSNGANTSSVLGLNAGSYTVTVTDAVGNTVSEVAVVDGHQWQFTAGKSGVKENSRDVKTDRFGNVYITGVKDPNTRFHGIATSGNGQGYLAKLDSCGNLVWVTDIDGGEGYDIVLKYFNNSSGTMRAYVVGGKMGSGYVNSYDFPTHNLNVGSGNYPVLNESFLMTSLDQSEPLYGRSLAIVNDHILISGTFGKGISFHNANGSLSSMPSFSAKGRVATFIAVLKDNGQLAGSQWLDVEVIGSNINASDLAILHEVEGVYDPISNIIDVYSVGRFKGNYNIGSNPVLYPQSYSAYTQGFAIKWDLIPNVGLNRTLAHQTYQNSYLFDVKHRSGAYNDLVVSALDNIFILDPTNLSSTCNYTSGNGKEAYTKIKVSDDPEDIIVGGSYLIGGSNKHEYAIVRSINFQPQCGTASLNYSVDAIVGNNTVFNRSRGWGVASFGNTIYTSGYFDRHITLGNQTYLSNTSHSRYIFLGRLLPDGMMNYQFQRKRKPNSEPTNESFSVYPNPSNGAFNLSIPKEWVGQNYDIIDIKGRVIIDGFASNTNNLIEAGILKKGIYFVRFLEAGRSQKIIVN